jgi:hypothetical protein
MIWPLRELIVSRLKKLHAEPPLVPKKASPEPLLVFFTSKDK